MNFRILGPIEVLSDHGGLLTLGKRKERALLAQLLLRAREVCTPDQLIDALWPDDPPARPDANLHSTVARLRRSLEPDRPAGAPSARLVRRTPGYVLEVADDEIDARRFERLAGEGHLLLRSGSTEVALQRLDAAIGEWNGPALAEFVYEPFADREAARLEELRLAVTEDALGARLVLGDQRTVPELEQAVAAYPLREHFWAYLLLALYRDGRQTDALRRADELRRILSDVGLDPSPRLVRLEAAILDHDPSLHTSADLVVEGAQPEIRLVAEEGGQPPRVPRWWRRSERFVGRVDELGRMGTAWTATKDGEVQLVAVVGEAGIGKSSLVVETAQGALADGATMLLGRCSPTQNLPYGPFVEALGPVIECLDPESIAAIGDRAAHLASLFPAEQARLGAPPRSSGSGDIDQYLLFEAMSELIAHVAEEHAVLLVIDDLQWAGGATLRLLDHLLHADQVRRLLVMVTIRDADLDAHPSLRGMLDQWIRDHVAIELPLRGLDLAELASLVDPDAATADPNLLDALHRSTGGNPFFAVETLRAVGNDPTSFDGRSVLPDSVQALVRTRLDRLSDPCRDVLASAALLEERIDIELLSRVFDDDVDIPKSLDEAVRAGLLVDLDRGLVFRHDLVRTALSAMSGPADRARRHRRLALAMLDRVEDPTWVAAELAHHFVAAAADGDAADAVRFSQIAGRDAIRRLAYDRAVATIERGLATLDAASPVAPADELELRLAAVEARWLNGDSVETVTRAVEVLDLALEHGEPKTWRQVAQAFVTTDFPPGLSADRALRTLDSIEEAMCAAPTATAEDLALVHLAQASVAHSSGLTDLVAKRMTGALEVFAESPDPQYLVTALDLVLGLEGERRPIGERCRLVAKMLESIELAASVRAETQVLAYSMARWIALTDGRIEEALRFDELLARQASALAMPRFLAGVAQRKAMLALVRGRHAEAETFAVEMLEHRPDEEFFEGYAAQLAIIRVEQGRAHEILPTLNAQDEGAPPVWMAGRAWLHAEVGELDAAQCLLDQLIDELPDFSRDITWLGTLTILAHVVDLVRDPRAATRLIAELGVHRSRVALGGRGTVCFGPVDLALGELYAVVGEADVAERHLDDAEPIIDALGADSLRVRRELVLAEALARCGPNRRQDALAHVRRAQSLMAHLRFGGSLAERGTVLMSALS